VIDGSAIFSATGPTRLNPNLPFLGALLVDTGGLRFCDEHAQGYSKLAGVIGLDVLARCRPATARPESSEEVTLTAITA
jgi:hypothetical protein